MSLTKVTYSMISGAPINVLDYGADPSGVADSTQAIQAAIDAAQALTNSPTISIPAGEYKITDTLTITRSNISIVGESSPSRGPGSDSTGTTRGSTLRYSGTGTAVLIGVAPDVNGTFIDGIIFANLRIEVDNTTQCALRVWTSSNGLFSNIAIFGNKGLGNVGLQVDAGVNNAFEYITVNGLGQTAGGSYSEYLEKGLFATLGYGNDLATVTTFKHCYFHYCNSAATIAYLYNFEDCVFEASGIGVTFTSDATAYFDRCWWEANGNYDISFANNNCTITNSRINAYARQQFFSSGGGLYNLTIEDSILNTSNAAPRLFGAAGGSYIFNPTQLADGGRVTLNRNTVPKDFTVGFIYNDPTVNLIQVEDMRKETYRFVSLSLAANGSTNPTPTGDGFTKYVMPEAGHIISVNVYTSAAIISGQWDIALFINGSSPTYPPTSTLLSTTSPFETRIAPYLTKFAKGDVLTVYTHASGSWNPTNDLCVEVTVSLGPDGTLLA